MRSFQEFISEKRAEYGDKFDPSDLAPDFIPYFENQKRIEVDFGYEVKRGRIGVTTGWRPCFLLMLTSHSISSPHTIARGNKVLRVVSR